MRFLTPSIVLFGSLYFVILGRRLRVWRETADVVAGTSGILWAALTFGVRYFPTFASGFASVRWILGGAEAGILITLLLTGSGNPFQKSGRMRNHGTEPVTDRDDLPIGGRISS
jgi:hypothetical protein